MECRHVSVKWSPATEHVFVGNKKYFDLLIIRPIRGYADQEPGSRFGGSDDLHDRIQNSRFNYLAIGRCCYSSDANNYS